ncbi:amino acid ABC transporter substrate-binding protein [Roseomonas stagni]|uniref:Amino acid ABC transporter substrate-binding protein n=1 Tax=Falsiroseomonas algicola TaxID=2716930 RepID=A0A6M1LQV6_9PROT|nr:amino acid ABC transporter substrate-binding protein [Falsiroseomonas algicola]NGM22786.1 amino acid ABC transporter substrate-binding protein [Falsiroseomonas algicola]
MLRNLLLGACLALTGIGAAAAGPSFDAVKARGSVVCGVNQGVAGFSAPDSRGEYRGLDADFCRALAAAIFGDPTKVRFVATSSQNRFTMLQSGEIDVLARNATQTLVRDTSLGLNMAGVNFYDGQGFLVRRSSGVTAARQLDGATVCIQPGTTSELNIADYFRANNIRFTPVLIERPDEFVAAYAAGRCDAMTQDASQLASYRATALQNPQDHVLLPERISKEPLGPMVRHGDDQWFDVVKWVLAGLIEAEEQDITQANVEARLRDPNPGVQRMLGVTAGFGRALGLEERWLFNAIKAVGNYGESFERHLGSGSPIGLPRGLNDLWTRGGLMYALPLR